MTWVSEDFLVKVPLMKTKVCVCVDMTHNYPSNFLSIVGLVSQQNAWSEEGRDVKASLPIGLCQALADE